MSANPSRSGPEAVPRIDVSALLGERPDAPAALEARRRMRMACADVGFMTVVGHGVAPGRIAAAGEAARRFFALSDEQKRLAAPQRWNPRSPNVYRGYFPASAAGKEGLDVGEPRLCDARLLARPYHEANRVAEALAGALGPDWWPAVTGYFDALSEVATLLLRNLVLALGGDAERVDCAFARPASLSTLRFNFYPDREEPVERAPSDGAALCCEEHVDSGLLTLLHQDDRGGLQVKGRDGHWHDVAPHEDAFVVNTGLALQRMTGRALVATRHRVLHARGARLSMPFFFEPVPDFEMDARSLGLPFAPAAKRQSYEAFLAESLAKFSEYAR